MSFKDFIGSVRESFFRNTGIPYRNLVGLLLGFLAFSLAYGYLMAVRMRIGRIEDRAASTVMSKPSPRARKPQPTPSAASGVALRSPDVLRSTDHA